MLFITSHATLLDGKIYDALTNNLVENLNKKKMSFIFIRHFMQGEKQSEIYTYQKGELISTGNLFIFSKISILRYLTEIFSTFLYISFSKHKNITYIGIDPLNSFTGYLLKNIGRIKKNIFYTPDYSPKRFNNNSLNNIYHLIDRKCLFNADEVWNASYRIYDVRKKMGLSDVKNILLPNVPGYISNEISENQKNRFHLITLGMIEDQLDFKGIFDAVKILKNQYPNMLLKIIGNGSKEVEYKDYVKQIGIKENVLFLGYLDHEKALEEISKSGIGLALYNGAWGFNYYGDSMKCREYLALGLPVLTTDTHSTAEDIQKMKAGIISEMNTHDYVIGIQNILKKYDEYSRNSFLLGGKYQDFYLEKINSLC